MADLSVKLENYLKNTGKSFEFLIKEMIKTPENIDIQDDILWNKLIKLTNSIQYWYKQFDTLITKHRVILTIFNPDSVDRLDFTFLYKEIDGIIGIKNVKEIYYPKNSNFIGIEIEDLKVLENLKDKLNMAGTYYVVNLAWGYIPRKVDLRLHWLPSEVMLEDINNLLNLYLQDVVVAKQKNRLYDCIYVNTNIYEVHAYLKDNISIDSIPYIVDISGFSTLINVKGRRPICLECRQIGHLRVNCKYKYCKICKCKIEKEHSCEDYNEKRLFASVLKENKDKLASAEYTQNVTINSVSQTEDKLHIDDVNKLHIVDVANKANMLTYAVKRNSNIRSMVCNNDIEDKIRELQNMADIYVEKNSMSVDLENMDTQLVSMKRRYEELSDEENGIVGDIDMHNSNVNKSHMAGDFLSPTIFDALVDESDAEI